MEEKIYQQRRHSLMSEIEEGVIILPSAAYQVRSNDTEYPFRQNSNFYYLSGFEEDHSVLVLKRSKKKFSSMLFVHTKDKSKELWSGKRLGVKAAKKTFEIDAVYAVDDFEIIMKKKLQGVSNVYVDLFNDEPFLQKIRTLCAALYRERSVKISPQSFHHLNPMIERMRLIKSDAEIKKIKKALNITKKAHEGAMMQAKEGMREYELQAAIEYVFKKNGAYSDAYTTIVAGGNNANTLHYIKNSALLKADDLVLIDAGCEYEMYASDITRTFPVSGKFSQAQKALYEMVLAVQLNIIKAIKPGVKRSTLQKMCEKQLCEGMIGLGILKGKCKALMKQGAHKKYFPHGVGHWMGIDVHDQAPYSDKAGKELLLQSGMVLTIEPGIYIDEKDKTVAKCYRGIGIRIEDNILVTAQGAKNLSCHIAKSVEEVEALCLKKHA
jgi:Xaa-Pro aminopeptidase